MQGPGAILATLLFYCLIRGAGMWLSLHGFGFVYGDPEMVQVLLPFEVVLAVLAVGAARSVPGVWSCGFDRINWSGLVCVVPFAAVQVAMALILGGKISAEGLGLTAMIVVTMGLVGVSEEVMFRGIILRGLLARMGPGRAILLSSAAFSAMHSINLAAGLSPVAVASQMMFTFAFGLAFAGLAFRINSLVPLIVLHALWDMLLFLGAKFGTQFGILPHIVMPMMMVTAAALWFGGLNRVSSSGR